MGASKSLTTRLTRVKTCNFRLSQPPRSTGQLGEFSASALLPHLPLDGASRTWARGSLSGGSSASALTGGEWQARRNSLTL
eukprot:3038866-Rhodomonas_salina.1